MNTAAPRAGTLPVGPRRWVVLLSLLVIWVVVYRVLHPIANWLAFDVLTLDPGTHLAQSVAFFLFEAPKVLMLLVLIVFAVGVVRTFFSPEQTRRALAGRRESAGNVLAAGLGVVTPFCSCSAVPLFLGFIEAGVPLGVTFSFLISAPMVNEVALVLLLGLFGLRVAGLYLATGLLIAVAAGWVLGKMRLERYLEPWVLEVRMAASATTEQRPGWNDRLDRATEAVREIVGKVWPYVLGGIAIGAGIHGYVPDGLLSGIMGRAAWWSVPAAVVVGVPMYANAAGIIPIVQALLEKGAALGTVLAFMMSVIALSLPEMVILRRVLRPQLIAAFIGIVAGGILVVGFLFNLVFQGV